MINVSFWEDLYWVIKYVVGLSIVSALLAAQGLFVCDYLASLFRSARWQQRWRRHAVRLWKRTLIGAGAISLLFSGCWSGFIVFLGHGLNQLAYRGGQGVAIAISPIFFLAPLGALIGGLGALLSEKRKHASIA